MLIWPVRQLGRVISEMSKAGVSIDRIRYIMNSARRRRTAKATQTASDCTGYRLRPRVLPTTRDREVLDDINFTIKAGSTVGILGGTGSGKSTLMYLLDRLYQLAGGREDHHRRRGHRGHQGGGPPGQHRHGAAGAVSVLRHAGGKHPDRGPGHDHAGRPRAARIARWTTPSPGSPRAMIPLSASAA